MIIRRWQLQIIFRSYVTDRHDSQELTDRNRQKLIDKCDTQELTDRNVSQTLTDRREERMERGDRQEGQMRRLAGRRYSQNCHREVIVRTDSGDRQE